MSARTLFRRLTEGEPRSMRFWIAREASWRSSTWPTRASPSPRWLRSSATLSRVPSSAPLCVGPVRRRPSIACASPVAPERMAITRKPNLPLLFRPVSLACKVIAVVHAVTASYPRSMASYSGPHPDHGNPTSPRSAGGRWPQALKDKRRTRPIHSGSASPRVIPSYVWQNI